MRVRKRPGVVVLFVLVAGAGFASTLVLGSARGDILPTLSVPSLSVSLPVTTAPLPPPPLPPAPPPPVLPPAPPLAPPPPVLHGDTTSSAPSPGSSAPRAPGASGASSGAASPGASSGSVPSSAATPSSRRAATAPHVSRARFHTRGRGRRGTTITFHLTAPATVVLLVRGPSPSCGLAGRRVISLGRGVSRVRFLGRFHGRPLAPGTYAITMVARRHGTRTMLGRLAIAVVPPGQRIDRSAERPVFTGCGSSSATGAASSQPNEPFAGLGLVLRTAAANVVGTPDRAKAPFRPPKLSVPVPRAPELPGSSGSVPAWLGALFYAVVMLAGAGLLALVLSFARERWNP
jgi:hypothetical protein